MEIFINEHGKLNKAVLPLRFGFSINQTHQSFATLSNAVFDRKGTSTQRGDEIERGNKHYLGNLIVNKENKNDGYHEHKGRFIIAPPPHGRDLDRLITALREDGENLKNDIATTKHLEGMLKRNKITTNEIIEHLHPAYITGKIMESNDIEDIFTEIIVPSRIKTNFPMSDVDQGFAEEGDEITGAAEDIDVEDEGEYEEIAPLVYKKLNLKPSIKYTYVMADAHILDAGKGDDHIWLKVINSKGVEQVLKSFSIRAHLSHHHERAFEYFSSRKGQRAFMAICNTGKYSGVLAESVTSIYLGLMRS